MGLEDHLILSVRELADLPSISSTLDKSQIGCYVSHNNRLIDVMVLSDQDYHIKIPIASKSTDEDKIQVMFKKLADDEEPIGK
jgi:hypothetical protein